MICCPQYSWTLICLCCEHPTLITCDYSSGPPRALTITVVVVVLTFYILSCTIIYDFDFAVRWTFAASKGAAQLEVPAARVARHETSLALHYLSEGWGRGHPVCSPQRWISAYSGCLKKKKKKEAGGSRETPTHSRLTACSSQTTLAQPPCTRPLCGTTTRCHVQRSHAYADNYGRKLDGDGWTPITAIQSYIPTLQAVLHLIKCCKTRCHSDIIMFLLIGQQDSTAHNIAAASMKNRHVERLL